MTVRVSHGSTAFRMRRRCTFAVKRSIESITGYRVRYHFPPSSDRRFVLTFDDGPQEATRKILDLLDRHDEKAVFFMLGENVLRHPDIAREVHARGHGIGSHGFSHISLKKIPVSGMIAQIRKSFAVIEEHTGCRTSWFRPPYGEIGPLQALALMREGITICLWACNVLDDGTIKFANPACDSTGNDCKIILLHDHLPLNLIDSAINHFRADRKG